MPVPLDNHQTKPWFEFKSDILETTHFRDLLKACRFNSCVIVDLDNTVIESTKEIGNDQWYAKLYEYACKTIPDQMLARRLVITILHEVQYRISVKTVENNTANIISILQDLDIPVLALTSRGEEIIDSTLRQLTDVGVDFTNYWGEVNLTLPVPDAPRPVYFKNGIVFCNGHDKGKCLNTFFDVVHYHPIHCAMIDDSEANLLLVKNALLKSGIGFTGLRYGYLDSKVKQFDMTKATTELIEISSLFSSDGQHAVDELKIKKYIEHRDRSNSILRRSFFDNARLSTRSDGCEKKMNRYR